MNSRSPWLPRLAGLLAGLLCLTGLAQTHAPGGHDDHGPDWDPPFHSGVVLEFNEEVHYEVVALPDGELQVWLSDGHRRPMAASEVTDVAAEVDHANKSAEPVDMQISADGGYWTGKARFSAPADVVRVGFIWRQESVTGSVAYSSLRAAASARADTHSAEAGR